MTPPCEVPLSLTASRSKHVRREIRQGVQFHLPPSTCAPAAASRVAAWWSGSRRPTRVDHRVRPSDQVAGHQELFRETSLIMELAWHHRLSTAGETSAMSATNITSEGNVTKGGSVICTPVALPSSSARGQSRSGRARRAPGAVSAGVAKALLGCEDLARPHLPSAPRSPVHWRISWNPYSASAASFSRREALIGWPAGLSLNPPFLGE
jgi:hypothetical protein